MLSWVSFVTNELESNFASFLVFIAVIKIINLATFPQVKMS